MTDAASLHARIAARATEDGTILADDSGVHFYRMSAPGRFRKMLVAEPRLIVVAQGRKVARFPEGDLAYDERHYLVLAGRSEFDGDILEASPERPYLAVCIALTPDVVARTLLAFADAAAEETTPSAPPPVPAFVAPLDAPIESAVTRLLAALDDPLERRVVAPLVMEELVFRLLRTDAAAWVRAAVREGDASIERAMRFMRANAARGLRDLSVDRVARHVGMSPSHFAHRFSEVARVSPMRFLKQVRLEAARELMLAQRVRAGEAALRVGYESASHFTRDFKSAYGAAPAEYVRRVRQG